MVNSQRGAHPQLPIRKRQEAGGANNGDDVRVKESLTERTAEESTFS